MEYLVRAARITDIDRLVSLAHDSQRSPGEWAPRVGADLLRQLVYLPQASVLVAEAGHELVGGAVLTLRPSVRAGGFVGTVDLLVVDRRRDANRVAQSLIDELIRSARNKGCSVVEAVRPHDPEERERLTHGGFTEADPLLRRPVGDRAVADRAVPAR